MLIPVWSQIYRLPPRLSKSTPAREKAGFILGISLVTNCAIINKASYQSMGVRNGY
jgi:hypothetical protein